MSSVFVSYIRENLERIDGIYHALTSRGIKVWLDRNDIYPGVRWKQAIRQAIQVGTFFIACFSKEYNERSETYMNEELIVAIEVLRRRSTDKVWFIPVILNECDIPEREIGGGETLKDLQWTDLHEDWDVGIQRILKVISPEASEAETYLRDAGAKAKQGDHERAITDYDRALCLKPDFAIAYLHRGIAKANMGLYSNAISDFDQALRIKRDYADVYVNRGVVKHNIELYNASIADYDEALRINPNDVLALVNRGDVKSDLKQFSAAIIDYDEALCLKPDFAEGYNNRGHAKRHLRQYDAAITDFDIVLQLNPNLAEPYYNRGLAKASQEHTAEAKKDFQTALRLAEGDGDERLRLLIERALRMLG